MPFIVKALLDKRLRYEQMAKADGEEALFRLDPAARGYLSPRTGYRLFDQRDRLNEKLLVEVQKNRGWLLDTLKYPLAASASVMPASSADPEK
jgi:deoxyhypusine synthase